MAVSCFSAGGQGSRRVLSERAEDKGLEKSVEEMSRLSQPMLEGMGELWKRTRQGEQGASKEQSEEQRERLGALFSSVPHRLRVQEGGRR